MSLLQIFLYDMPAMLLWYVQKFVAISWSVSELQQYKFVPKFELW